MSNVSDSSMKDEKPAKPVRRFGTGALSLLQVACVTVLFAGLNYLGAKHYVPKDLSADSAYMLSPATQRYLESPAVRDRTEPIRLLLAFRRSSPIYDRVRALGEEYFRLSGGKVKLELLDPVRSPDRTQQVAKEYGDVFQISFNKSMFTTDLVIVDARTKDQKQVSLTAEAAGNASSHVHFIEAERMIRYETEFKGENSQRKITGFLGEDAITTGIVSALEGKPRKIYLLADKSGFRNEGADSPLTNFEATLLSQNALTLRAQISGIDRIPDDVSAVAIINPAYDFSPQELAVLTEYWERPKSSVLVTLGSADTPPRLRAFLRNLGITPRKDRVISKKGDQVVTNVRAGFTAGMDFTRDFANKTTIFEGATSSLEVREKDNDEFTAKGIRPYVLIETDRDFWGETKFSTAKPEFDRNEDYPGPLSLAGAVIRGAATRDDLGDRISRMVVVSNSEFLSPRYFSDINKDFLASSVNWLIGREDLAGTGPRTLGSYKLPLLDSQVSFINRVNLFFLPAFGALIAGLVWSSRRA
ncbi:GldG family protein [Luteolibacter flavescens]|uniref:GldG family protein n=1 Tax=Luteolibacter flavescens TaxID=1859460 RepID=A0ABT3FMD1_9BACT|nr:GldG family protein [Luteolibacter flavescens]MCW1884731.1 GldG family protein [Luteolibacter flavescens]